MVTLLFWGVIALTFFLLGWVLGCGSSVQFWPREPRLDEEWYCRLSGYAKDEVMDHGCFHDGPCEMDIRKTVKR